MTWMKRTGPARERRIKVSSENRVPVGARGECSSIWDRPSLALRATARAGCVVDAGTSFRVLGEVVHDHGFLKGSVPVGQTFAVTQGSVEYRTAGDIEAG
jgi:hypothetical protein